MKELIDDITSLHTGKINNLRNTTQPKIGWTSISTPEEIFFAAGLTPVRITGDLGANLLGAGALLSYNYCSYVLNCLAEGLEGHYDFLDGFVVVDACDERKRLYEVWKRKMKTGHVHLLELPKDVTNKYARGYFKNQLVRLIDFLEKEYQCSITPGSLRNAIQVYNKSRSLMQKMVELRKNGLDFITGVDTLNIIKASTSGFRHAFNEKLSALLAKAEKEAPPKPKKHRVLLVGSYFDVHSIIDSIEKLGAQIVCEDTSNGIKNFEGQINETIDPLDAVTDYYFHKSTCARVMDTDKRVNRLLSLIQEYQIDSVIYVTLKFCNTNLIDLPYIRHQLIQNKIPVLFIEAEQNMINIENIKTRIMAYLETRMN